MDGLRFVAIAMVVCFHLNGYLAAKWPLHHPGTLPQSSWLAQTALAGFRGVELFFVISGFILALPFAAHRLTGAPQPSLRKYYLRRLTRLEPPYFVTLFVLFALAVLVQGRSASDQLPHLGASLLYLHNLIYGSASSVIGVAWSLEIEVQFYLLVPLLTVLFAIPGRGLRRAALAGLILSTISMQSILQPNGRVSLSILAYLQFFLTGFLLADFFVASWKQAPTTTFYWDIVSVIGWPLLGLTLRYDSLAHWLFPIFLFALYCAAFRGRLTSRLLSHRSATIIGGMCYSIYLIHYEVISFAGRFLMRLGDGYPVWAYFLIQLTLIGVAIVCTCGLYFLVLERPCMRRDWPQRLRNRWREWMNPAEPAVEMSAVQ